MRALSTTCVITAVLCTTSSLALADDLTPPPWDRYTSTTTFAHWQFTSPQEWHWYPESVYNPYGEMFIEIWEDTFWWPAYAGRIGVLETPFVEIQAANHTTEAPVSHKEIYLQITWHDSGQAPDIVECFPGGSVTLTDAYSLGGGWHYTRYEVYLEPNPDFEIVHIMPATYPDGVMMIDQIVFDSKCFALEFPGWGVVTDEFFHSPPNSVDIYDDADIVRPFSESTSGQWVFTTWTYVPASFVGSTYFILLNTYDPPAYNWSTQLRLDAEYGIVESEFDGAALELVVDEWVEVCVEIDLDADVQRIYYGGELLTEKSWTEGVSGGGLLNVAAVNLYGNGASSTYYDDISLASVGPPPPPNGACCFYDTSCADLPEEECLAEEGVWQGESTACVWTECPPPLGACCFHDGRCEVFTQERCGDYVADWYEGEDCATFACPMEPHDFASLQDLTGVWHSDAQWGDFDNDGDLDLVLCGAAVPGDPPTDLATETYRNDGGTLSLHQELEGVRSTGSGNLAWGDYDGDGDLDLAMAGTTEAANRIARVYENDGSGNLTWDAAQVLTGVHPAALAWGDYDNDGDLDLVITGASGPGTGSAILYENEPHGTLTPAAVQPLVGLWAGSVDWADIDNDGDLDLWQTGTDGDERTILYVNDPLGTLTANETHGVPGVTLSDVAWGDCDADGDLDLAITGNQDIAYDHVARVYANDGAGNLTQVGPNLASIYRSSCAWGDYDNDGDLDIAFMGYTGTSLITRIYENTVAGFSSAFSFPAVYEGSATFADLDGDGDLDFHTTGFYNWAVPYAKLYEKTGGFPNNPPCAPSVINSTPVPGGLQVSWGTTSDAETPVDGLCYCLQIGTSAGADDVLSSAYGTPLMGNVGQATDLVLEVLAGTYYGRVRTVDSGFMASSWSAETVCEVYGVGDMNCDGAVNFFDIDAFVLALTDPAGYPAEYPDCYLWLADCNGDGLVNFFDIDAFVALITGGG